MVLLLVFMQLTRDLFAIAKFLFQFSQQTVDHDQIGLNFESVSGLRSATPLRLQLLHQAFAFTYGLDDAQPCIRPQSKRFIRAALMNLFDCHSLVYVKFVPCKLNCVVPKMPSSYSCRIQADCRILEANARTVETAKNIVPDIISRHNCCLKFVHPP